MTDKSSPADLSRIAEKLRTQRVDVLHKGLREMAKLLDVAPAHVTDIEKGRRAPSEDLLVKMARCYEIDEAVLRTAYGKADKIVAEVATKSESNARMVPELLRTAQDLSQEQWRKLIKQAQRLAGDDAEKKR